MCSAVRRRMFEKGTTVSAPRSPRVTGDVTGAGAAGGGLPARRASITASTSLRVMRPPAPVPLIWEGSRPCSASSRRTTGDSTLPLSPAVAGAGPAGRVVVAGWGGGAAGGRGGAAGCGVGGATAGGGGGVAAAGGGAGCGGAAGGAISVAGAASDTGDGTSESTLSVETSKSTSSSATASPTCLNHFVMVPSVTVSPSWGIVTSAMQTSPGECHHRLAEQLAQRGAAG